MKIMYILLCSLALIGCDNTPANQSNTNHIAASTTETSQNNLDRGKFNCEPIINPNYYGDDGRKEWLLPMECEKNSAYYGQYRDVKDKYYTYRQPYNASPPTAYTVAAGATGVLTGAAALMASKAYQKYFAQKKAKPSSTSGENSITNNKISATKAPTKPNKSVATHH